MTMTPEKLREWADELERTGVCFSGPPADQLRAHADALEELARLRARLEIDFAADGNGKRVPSPAGGPDGIACRDETIRLLEAALSEANRLRGKYSENLDIERQRLADAERKCERLRFHAEALRDRLASEYTRGPCVDQSVGSALPSEIYAYDAEFKEDKP